MTSNNAQNILIKTEETTDSSFGKRPEERSIEESLEFGMINLNKPQGPSSHQVADFAKKIIKVKRAGHSGTLEK